MCEREYRYKLNIYYLYTTKRKVVEALNSLILLLIIRLDDFKYLNIYTSSSKSINITCLQSSLIQKQDQ